MLLLVGLAGCASSEQSEETPLRQMAGLQYITFWEATGGVQPFAFAINSTELTTRRSDPLGDGNQDFYGVKGQEPYDVFLSNADGTFNPNGGYITIEAGWNHTDDSGLNISEVQLNFVGGTRYACEVTSFTALGDNAVPKSVENAVDGDLWTYTLMGNTVGQTRRLRLTVGVNCLRIECPAPMTLECVNWGAVANFTPIVTGGWGERSLTCQPPSGSRFPLGCTTDTCTVTDSAHQSASCSFPVCVVDTRPPVVTIKSTRVSLWAPNHHMQRVKLSDCVESVVDECGGPLDVDTVGTITRIESDEAEDDSLVDDVRGDGNTCKDIVLSGSSWAELRSERLGGGDGRVYTVHFTVHDTRGNSTASSCKMQVVHDQSAPSNPAVDGGCRYCEGSGCGSCPRANPACGE